MRSAEAIHLTLIPGQLSIYDKASVRQKDRKVQFLLLMSLQFRTELGQKQVNNDYNLV